ncbi:uncharacterized protein BX663DRAFT_554638 [Cokeromyces recurvatus]|uniref:uncharacterized protein n=1 Tax=Cokeromyces recurvatus TaxID=90255 RepID=UPI002220F30C|nr:uncharacterized protein BX663DRAFT_554638 [Cokeromyces recurvatus]KAI7899683.1 hypothetical protein BX663DRAFT_554638 [Cokeromyces recurvatus]
MDANIAFSLNEEAQGNIRALLKPLIWEIRNRLPSFPMTKETLNKAPFGIIPALRYILVKYEALIEENPQTQPGLLEQSEQTNPPNRKRLKKKKVKKNKKTSKDNKKKKTQATSPSISKTSLELHNFTSEEINRYFRPCAVDPNRKDAFVSYHENTDIRRLSSAEYYDMSGNVNRQKMEKEHKRRSNVETVETQIPSSKTTFIDHYKMYITYMLQHMEVLFDFYSFETARIYWLSYVGSQRGKTKRNKRKRRKTEAKYDRDPPDTHPNRGKNATREHWEKFEESDSRKMPLVVFGNGLKNKSQTCNSCLETKLQNLIYGKGGDAHRIHQIFICKSCYIYWNRDVLAAKNMLTIATSI